MADGHVSIPGYSVIRQYCNRIAGGILLYIKDNLKGKVLHASKTTCSGKRLKSEYLSCEMWEESSNPVLIVLVYRPPNVLIRSERKLVSLNRTTCSDYSHKN